MFLFISFSSTSRSSIRKNLVRRLGSKPRLTVLGSRKKMDKMYSLCFLIKDTCKVQNKSFWRIIRLWARLKISHPPSKLDCAV